MIFCGSASASAGANAASSRRVGSSRQCAAPARARRCGAVWAERRRLQRRADSRNWWQNVALRSYLAVVRFLSRLLFVDQRNAFDRRVSALEQFAAPASARKRARFWPRAARRAHALARRLDSCSLLSSFCFRRGGWLTSSSLAPVCARRGFARCSFAASSSLPFVFLKNFAHGSSRLKQSHVIVRQFLPMHCLVNLARLCFIDGENIDQILHVRIAQSFQIGKAGFHQGQRLLFGDREARRQVSAQLARPFVPPRLSPTCPCRC